MGFGLLFAGYLLLFICKGVDIFPDIAAYAFMFAALCKLSPHNKSFSHAKLIMYPLMAVSVLNDTVLIISAAGADFAKNTVFTALGSAVSAVNTVILIVFYYYLLNGIRLLAEQVDVPKIASNAKRNWYITVVYSAMAFVLSLGITAVNSLARYFGLPFLVFGLVWIVLNAVLIFKCYMYICLEGDEDMPVKPKRSRKESEDNK